MIVLDTNVVSEPLKSEPDANVIRWLSKQAPETLFITAITSAELRSGVELMPRGRRRDALANAIDSEVLTLFDGRVLAFDSECAMPFGLIIAKANKAGNRIGFPDAAIAAISLLHGFQVATRNVNGFAATGVKIINPWMAND
jgi:toxin FitB